MVKRTVGMLVLLIVSVWGLWGCGEVLGIEAPFYRLQDAGQGEEATISEFENSDAGAGLLDARTTFITTIPHPLEAGSPDEGTRSDGSALDDAHAAGLADGDTGALDGDEGETGCKLTQHDDGFGDSWYDCFPSGTYTEEEAMAACNAKSQGRWSCYDPLVNDSGVGCPGVSLIYILAGNGTYGWVYHAGVSASFPADTVVQFPSCTSIGIWQ